MDVRECLFVCLFVVGDSDWGVGGGGIDAGGYLSTFVESMPQ